jgi:hypothetical protein
MPINPQASRTDPGADDDDGGRDVDAVLKRARARAPAPSGDAVSVDHEISTDHTERYEKEMALRLPHESGREQHDAHGYAEDEAEALVPSSALAHEKSGRRREQRKRTEHHVDDGHHHGSEPYGTVSSACVGPSRRQ